MEDTSSIIWGILFGSIGLGYFMYGKKQRAGIPLGVGIAFMIVPYLISDIYMLVAAGAGLMALAYFVRL